MLTTPEEYRARLKKAVEEINAETIKKMNASRFGHKNYIEARKSGSKRIEEIERNIFCECQKETAEAYADLVSKFEEREFVSGKLKHPFIFAAAKIRNLIPIKTLDEETNN